MERGREGKAVAGGHRRERGGGLRGKDDGWRDVKGGRGGERQGAGITNESSLLFSQLFFSAP